MHQGDPLSPTLFNVFVNSLFDGLPGAFVPGVGPVPGLLYADDAAIMADSADDLAAALAAVDDWCDASGLALNAAKCKVMVLHGAAPAADGVSPHAAAARVDWRVRGGAVATPLH